MSPRQLRRRAGGRARLCDDDASTEGECRDLTTSDAEICAGSGDAEKFGDLRDGVRAAFVHGSLLGGMDDTEKRVGAA
jgi:hypothetical protein